MMEHRVRYFWLLRVCQVPLKTQSRILKVWLPEMITAHVIKDYLSWSALEVGNNDLASPGIASFAISIFLLTFDSDASVEDEDLSTHVNVVVRGPICCGWTEMVVLKPLSKSKFKATGSFSYSCDLNVVTLIWVNTSWQDSQLDVFTKASCPISPAIRCLDANTSFSFERNSSQPCGWRLDWHSEELSLAANN